MMTRNVSLTILIIFTTLFLSNPVFSQDEIKNDESSRKEKIKSKIQVSGELRIIDESNEKEEVKSKLQISGELKLIDLSDKKEAKKKGGR